MDDDANAFALVPLLAARLLRSGQDSFKVAEVDNDVAALKALDIAVDQIAGLIDILFVDVVADSVAHFLKQDLFRGLRGDSSEFFHRQGQQQSVANFDFVAGQLSGLVD